MKTPLLVGAKGDKGDKGDIGGAVTLDYLWDTGTSDADPGAGKIRGNNATTASITTLYIDLVDYLGGTQTAVIDLLDASTSTTKGYLRLVKRSDTTQWMLFSLSARTTATGYRKLTVAQVAQSGASPFSNADEILIEFTRTGDKGDTGAGGGGTTFEAFITSLSGLVHRWKFDEASGNFADSVGSLSLAVSGTWTYRQGTAPISSVGAAKMGASAKAHSSGMGSVPVGAGARTVVMVFKPTATGKQTLYSYGTWSSTRQMFTGFINDGSTGQTSLAVWADDLLQGASFADNTSFWHIVIQMYDGVSTTWQFIDGQCFVLGVNHGLGGSLNTVDAGQGFQIGQEINSGDQASLYVDDLAVFNRMLDIYEVKKLMNLLGFN